LAGWYTLTVLVPRPLVQATSGALLALGATGLQEDLPPGAPRRYRQPWDRGPGPRAPRTVLLRGWFEVRPEEAALAAALDGRALGPPEWGRQEEEDWNEGWKRHFRPVHIDGRLTVAAPWHGVPDALLIEPGNAFGTGDHPTTRACLHAIARHARPGARLLDVGCGSGILALAGAKLGMEVWGIDTDPDSVRAARAAATLTGLAARIDGTPLDRVEERFELVVANLYAEVLAELAPDLIRVSCGVLAFAGILEDRADLVRAAFAARRCLRDEAGEGWVALEYGPG
jgi:ribosomal protein L11 methyltransferase